MKGLTNIFWIILMVAIIFFAGTYLVGTAKIASLIGLPAELSANCPWPTNPTTCLMYGGYQPIGTVQCWEGLNGASAEVWKCNAGANGCSELMKIKTCPNSLCNGNDCSADSSCPTNGQTKDYLCQGNVLTWKECVLNQWTGKEEMCQEGYYCSPGGLLGQAGCYLDTPCNKCNTFDIMCKLTCWWGDWWNGNWMQIVGSVVMAMITCLAIAYFFPALRDMQVFLLIMFVMTIVYLVIAYQLMGLVGAAIVRSIS